VAITGLVLEVVYFRTFPQWLALSFFLGLGWVGTYSDFKFRRTFPKHSSGLIVLGGVLYSIGAAFDFMRWPNPFPGLVNAHEVFHFFVTIAALTHWMFIYRWCDYPVSDQIVCHIKIYPSNQYLIEGINDRLCLVGNCIESLKAETLQIMRLRYKQIKGHRVLFRYLKEEVAHQGGEHSSNLV
jgi:hypothetical protein